MTAVLTEGFRVPEEVDAWAKRAGQVGIGRNCIVTLCSTASHIDKPRGESEAWSQLQWYRV